LKGHGFQPCRTTSSIYAALAAEGRFLSALAAILETRSKRQFKKTPSAPGAPHKVLLVMDSTTGQNGLEQARLFTQSAEATGILLTKLDGTAKGGIAVAIARELRLPDRFVGVGEKMTDLLEFSPEEFVDPLLG
jgi:fused signal recognition particle receptor